MANPQIENGYIRIANEIWDEVIRRNFSKRQKDILLFIWRLSYGCQKKYAVIPKMKDFEICGVSATQIKPELEYLEQCQVLKWDRENKTFEINKDYERWQINPVKGWDKERFDNLIRFNLAKDSQNMKKNFIKREVHWENEDDDASQNMNVSFMNHEVLGPGLNQKFTKHEDENSQNMKSDFTKHEDSEPEIPCPTRPGGMSKDIIKDSIKDADDVVDDVLSEAEIEKRVAEIEQYFVERRGAGLFISPEDHMLIQQMVVDGLPIDLIKDSINQSFDNYKPRHKHDRIRTISYCVPLCYDNFYKKKLDAEFEKRRLIEREANQGISRHRGHSPPGRGDPGGSEEVPGGYYASLGVVKKL